MTKDTKNKISKITKRYLISSIIASTAISLSANATHNSQDNASKTHSAAHLTTHATNHTTNTKHSPLKSQNDKVSYTIGYQIGQSFHEHGVNINQEHFKQGLKDGIHGGKTALTSQQMKEVMMKFQTQMVEKMQKEKNTLGAKNLTVSNQYIDKISKTKGIKKITNGLYYKVLKAGKGVKPKQDDTVTVNYEGKLISGKLFDSSYKRGKPAEFKVNQVIPGWTKALQAMPQGSTWMLYIAPDLAYGKFAPPSIGPNQALIFKVELIKVTPSKTNNSHQQKNKK